MDTEVHPAPHTLPPILKYSSCVLIIVPQVVDILMLVAISETVPAVDQAEREAFTPTRVLKYGYYY